MAARRRYQFLTAIVITNTLLTVSAEFLFGEKVDDEFDFDGLPGVQHEFKVEVGAGREECFYQHAAKTAKLHVSYEVLRGGDRTIDFYLRDPHERVVDVFYTRSYSGVEKDIEEPGVYKICFDNTKSRFVSKLVFFYIVTFVEEQWENFTMELNNIHELARGFGLYLMDVGALLFQVTQHQMDSRMEVTRDWYLIQANNSYVFYWSCTQCAVIIIAAACQVVFLRRMFRVPAVATSKPRA